MNDKKLVAVLSPIGVAMGITMLVVTSIISTKMFGLSKFSTIFFFIPSYVLTLLGIICILIWFSFFFLGAYHFNRSKSFYVSKHFKTDGIYKFVRNPSYSGITFGLLGIGLLLNQFGLVLTSILWLLVTYSQCIREEEELEHLFGEKYLKYKNSTPRYLPRIDILLNEVLKKIEQIKD